MKKIMIVLIAVFTAGAAFAGGRAVDYTVGAESFEGYYISPKDRAPLVLLIHDWDGLTDYEVKRAGMLADKGYAVFAADLFGRGIRPSETDEKKKLTGALYKDRERMRTLIKGALDAAVTAGGNAGNAVVMGYCFGGTAVLEFARSGENLKGFVTFHGGLATPEGQDYSKTSGKILVLHGTADASVSMTDFANLAAALEEKKISHEMVTYSGAPHAFSVFGSERYREDADRKSWNRFLGFLDETLEK